MSNLLSKTTLRQLVAKGDLKAAAEAALEYALYCNATETANQFTTINSRLGLHFEQWHAGTLDYEGFARSHAKLAQDITATLETLPDQPSPQAGKQKRLLESTFKKRLFYLMIAAKAAVLLYLFYHSNFPAGTGGFTKAELFSTLSLLFPVFITYFSAMLADYIRLHHDDIQPVKRYVSGPLVSMAYWLLLFYVGALIFVIKQKAATEFSFEEMNTGLAMVETILGGYVGQIVFAFFKKQG